MYQFKNLVFEGGGVKGIAYIGALEVLEQEGILPKIERVGGTSAGAINAILAGLNFTQKETQDILWAMNFKAFMDDSWGLIRDSERLIEKFGWYKGDYFRRWIAKLIQQKTGNSEATFADIEALKEKKGFRSLFFMGTNLSTGFAEVFSAEHTPRMCIADAVRMSMSIPLFFAAKRSIRGDVYVDGGVLDNYPIKLFDRKKYIATEHFAEPKYYQTTNKALEGRERPVSSQYVYNKETLGFRLDSSKEIAVFRDQAEPPTRDIDNFFDYTWALIDTMIESQQSYHLHSDDWHRTVYIDTLGVKTTEFDLSDDKKHELVASGVKASQDYLKWFNGRSKKANKI